MPKNKEIVLFDDVFFTSALSGITKYWQNILDHMNQSSINGELPFELVMLNRSDKLKSLSFRQIDFPFQSLLVENGFPGLQNQYNSNASHAQVEQCKQVGDLFHVYFFINCSISSALIGMFLKRSLFPFLVIQKLFSIRTPIFSSSI